MLPKFKWNNADKTYGCTKLPDLSPTVILGGLDTAEEHTLNKPAEITLKSTRIEKGNILGGFFEFRHDFPHSWFWKNIKCSRNHFSISAHPYSEILDWATFFHILDIEKMYNGVNLPHTKMCNLKCVNRWVNVYTALVN